MSGIIPKDSWFEEAETIMPALRRTGFDAFKIFGIEGKRHRQDSGADPVRRENFKTTWDEMFILASQSIR